MGTWPVSHRCPSDSLVLEFQVNRTTMCSSGDTRPDWISASSNMNNKYKQSSILSSKQGIMHQVFMINVDQNTRNGYLIRQLLTC